MNLESSLSQMDFISANRLDFTTESLQSSVKTEQRSKELSKKQQIATVHFSRLST